MLPNILSLASLTWARNVSRTLLITFVLQPIRLIRVTLLFCYKCLSISVKSHAQRHTHTQSAKQLMPRHLNKLNNISNVPVWLNLRRQRHANKFVSEVRWCVLVCLCVCSVSLMAYVMVCLRSNFVYIPYYSYGYSKQRRRNMRILSLLHVWWCRNFHLHTHSIFRMSHYLV